MTHTPEPPPMPWAVPPETPPEELPILPLFNAVLFLKTVLPLMLLQGESVRLAGEAMPALGRKR